MATGEWHTPHGFGHLDVGQRSPGTVWSTVGPYNWWLTQLKFTYYPLSLHNAYRRNLLHVNHCTAPCVTCCAWTPQTVAHTHFTLGTIGAHRIKRGYLTPTFSRGPQVGGSAT